MKDKVIMSVSIDEATIDKAAKELAKRNLTIEEYLRKTIINVANANFDQIKAYVEAAKKQGYLK